MNRTILICCCALLSHIASAQSLFFGTLHEAVWTSHADSGDSLVRWHTDIPLVKFSGSPLQLSENSFVWTFADSTLTIAHYNASLKKETARETFRYSVTDDSMLRIELANGTTHTYEVGITSSGNFASLMKARRKKMKQTK